MVSARVLVVAVLAASAGLLLAGCADLNSGLSPLGPGALDGGALELGKLEINYDLASGETSGGFEPSSEAGARFDASTVISTAFGKSVYDNRQDIRELRPTGSTKAVGLGMIVSVVMRNASNAHFLGPRLVGTWAAGTNGIYAKDSKGVRLAGEVTPYDPDVKLGPGRNFMVANDSSQVVPPDYAFTQSSEFRSIGYAQFTQINTSAKQGVWRFAEIPQGATKQGSSDPYAYGPAYVSSTGARVQPTTSNMVALAMVFTVPPGAASVRIYGTVYVDAAIVTNTAGQDLTDISPAVTTSANGVGRDTTGRIYVVDGTQVRRLTAAGAVETADLLENATKRAALNQIAVVGSPYNKLYVVDTAGQVRIFDNTSTPAKEVYRLGVTNAFGVAVDAPRNRLFVSTNRLGTANDGAIRSYALSTGGVPTSTTPSATATVDLGLDTVAQYYDAGGQLQVDATGKVYVAAKTAGILRFPATLGAFDKTYQTSSATQWKPSLFCQFAVLADGSVIAFDRAGALPGADGVTGASAVVGDNGPFMFTRNATTASSTDLCGVVKFASDGSITAASRLWSYFGATQTQVIRCVSGGSSPIAMVPDEGSAGASGRLVMLYDPLLATPGSGKLLRLTM